MGFLSQLLTSDLFLATAGALFGVVFGLFLALGVTAVVAMKWLNPIEFSLAKAINDLSAKMDGMEGRLNERIHDVKTDLSDWIERVERRLNGYLLEGAEEENEE